MFKKILIANRGEIAVRVARTARKMGVSTVAVFSDADRDAPHVRACDEAVYIGPSPAAESYLRTEKILDAIKKTGAEGAHPGYGFLSENAEFADALEKAGVVFIGPTAETIRAMGSKSAAKDLMEAADVPTTPGYQGADQSVEIFKKEAARIGYPVLLKATAGGGGKGMRMVEKEHDLEDALKSAQREAKSAFGDDRFLIEKYIARARHVEVQIFGDGTGNVVHMYERDCSIQRRHQKVIEEAPAPGLSDDLRASLLKAGVDAGKAVNYRGAGTVEFLYDPKDEKVYFMEMNTRLQVEHPVSEAITGLDFVEWQLRIAAGEGLPLAQDEIGETGHAFEARLYAENPASNFAPSIGTLTTLRLPVEHARIDSGVEEGQAITPYYDPMIAKVITYGTSRDEALGRLRATLKETRVAGLEMNAQFLYALAAAPDFIAGDVSTRFIEEHKSELFDDKKSDKRVWAAVALWKLEQSAPANDDPWASLKGFRLNRPTHELMWIDYQGAPAIMRLSQDGDDFKATLEPDAAAAARREGREPQDTLSFSFSGTCDDTGTIRMSVDQDQCVAFVTKHGDGLRVWIGADHWDVTIPDPLLGISAHHSSEGSLTAPMPGVITLLSAKVGDTVEAGAPLLIMEAMKMEHAVKAPFDGTVKSYRFAAGDQVKDGDLLVEFEESA
ncbi:acetyl/propionyl/methylcrotonyl-CoA carboxylase subunit alpha [Hyphococcus sp. DH-69]|uniref:acetyl/propionyl/methylcrotonyl-CoA carboxylase subunit alpha n=1 Tax=Hyphococcus formosus TaxID=3143534 RepID=UPI00398B4597